MSTNRANDAYQLDQGNPDGCYFTWTRGDATGGLIAADAVTGKLKLVSPDLAGIDGATGIQGPTGLRGMTGVQGNSVTGGTGIAGMTGVQGNTVTGETGVQGNSVTGGTGIQGETGVQGVTGVISGWSGSLFGATGIFTVADGLIVSVA